MYLGSKVCDKMQQTHRSKTRQHWGKQETWQRRILTFKESSQRGYQFSQGQLLETDTYHRTRLRLLALHLSGSVSRVQIKASGRVCAISDVNECFAPNYCCVLTLSGRAKKMENICIQQIGFQQPSGSHSSLSLYILKYSSMPLVLSTLL